MYTYASKSGVTFDDLSGDRGVIAWVANYERQCFLEDLRKIDTTEQSRRGKKKESESRLGFG